MRFPHINALMPYTNSQPAPSNEREVFLNIFDYIDRLFAMVRPRKVLYMAIGELLRWRFTHCISFLIKTAPSIQDAPCVIGESRFAAHSPP